MIFITIFGISALWIVSTVLNGWALKILWGWFVSPTFGLPELSIPIAIGIGLLINFISHHEQHTTKGSTDITATIVAILLRPFFALLLGWIIVSVFMK